MPHELVVGGTGSGKSTEQRASLRALFYEHSELAKTFFGMEEFTVVWLDPQRKKSGWEFYQDMLGLGLDGRVIFESMGDTDFVIPF